jgi:hypothetical protein
MVKNTTGGGNNKKFARKYAAGAACKAGNKLRVSEDEGELYAICIKNLGNNMFHAVDTNSDTYLVHIRGKFSGRGRRDNTVSNGVWVLIGLREWSNNGAATSGGKQKMPQCDLLEVYSEQDKTRLKDAVDDDWDILLANDPTRINKEDDQYEDEIHWQSAKDAEKDILLAQLNENTVAKITLASTTSHTAAAAATEMEIYVEDI